MKVLVIGGSGFIGSHVAEALSDAGHEVTVLDRHRSPYVREDQSFVTGDILDREHMRMRSPVTTPYITSPGSLISTSA